MKIIFFQFLSLLLFSSAQAKVQVAFLEFYNPKGELVRLEPGGRFGHIAISYKGGWLHSFPPRPVEWVKELKPFGKVSEIIEVHRHPNYLEHIIHQEMGKPSQVNSDWLDETTTYCSKLVGKLLGIPPRPTNWRADVWQDQPNDTPLAEDGLSPDDIYEHLIANRQSEKLRLIPANSCSQSLN